VGHKNKIICEIRDSGVRHYPTELLVFMLFYTIKQMNPSIKKGLRNNFRGLLSVDDYQVPVFPSKLNPYMPLGLL